MIPVIRLRVARGEVGNVNVPITAEIAEGMYEQGLCELARPFIDAGGPTPRYRLESSDDRPIPALLHLKSEVTSVKRWAEAVLLQAPTHVNLASAISEIPNHVYVYWHRYPVELYRALAGQACSDAVIEVRRRRAALEWAPAAKRFLELHAKGRLSGGLVLPMDDPSPRRPGIPLTKHCDPALVAAVKSINDDLSTEQ